MNLVFAAMLAGKHPPPSAADVLGGDPAGAYARSAQLLLEAFGVPGVLEQSFQSPIGTATGLERLQIRNYDLLAHLWIWPKPPASSWRMILCFKLRRSRLWNSPAGSLQAWIEQDASLPAAN